MFPIGWMYYFGLNLDTRFSVPDFWPEEGSTHRIPFEKDELKALGERLRGERLERRRRRLEKEGGGVGVGSEVLGREGEKVERLGKGEGEGEGERSGSGTFGVGSIERWARGRWRD